MTDIWDKGSLNKTGLWSFYTVANLTGSLACAIPLIMIYQSAKKTAGDIYFGLLCIACILMSTPCGIQCGINLFSGTGVFQYGTYACNLEAYFHVSSIILQFHSTALISWNFYNVVVLQKHVTTRKACIISAVSFSIAGIGTAILGHFSENYLMPSGVYCFYQFTSPVMAYWFVPTLVICAGLICYWYFKIWQEVRKTENNAEKTFGPISSPIKKPREQNNFVVQNNAAKQNQIDIAKQFFLFVLALLVGWFPAPIGTIFEFVTGTMTEWLDIFVGVDGTMHTWFVFLIYGRKQNYFRRFLAKFCCTNFLAKYRWLAREKDITIVTVISSDEKKSGSHPKSAQDIRCSQIKSDVIRPHSRSNSNAHNCPGLPRRPMHIERTIPREAIIITDGEKLQITIHAPVESQIRIATEIPHDPNTPPNSESPEHSDPKYKLITRFSNPPNTSDSSEMQLTSCETPSPA